MLFKMRILCLIPALIFFVILPARGEELTPQKFALVQKIAKADGSDLQLIALGPQLLEGLLPFTKKMPAQRSNALLAAMGEQFDGNRLFESYEANLAHEMRQESLEAVMPWYDSVTGHRISALQLRSNTPEAVTALKAYGAVLVKKPPSAARIKLVRDLDQAIKATDLLVDITVNVTAGVLAGIAVVQKNDGRAQVAQMRAQLAQLRKKVRPEIEQSLYVNFLYTFREATDAQLQEYVKFLGTPAGHLLSNASYSALDDTLKGAAQRVGASVGAEGSVKADH